MARTTMPGGTERRWVVAAALVALAAIAAIAVVRMRGESAADARLERIERLLAAEATERIALQKEVAALRSQVDGVAADLWLAAATRPAGGLSEPPSSAPGERPSPAAAPRPRDAEPEARAEPVAADRSQQPLFDDDSLVAEGRSRGEVEQLRRRWQRHELDRLEVNDRAMREGYFMTPRHRDEHFALDAAFRSDVGDEGYDAFLRATGKANRVSVRDVLPGSSGDASGLRPGDEIVGYAGRRVFSTAEIQLATASGQRGERVALEVVRDGQRVTLDVERGPLGVILEPVPRPPLR